VPEAGTGRDNDVQPFRGSRVTGWSEVAGLGAYRDGVAVICELAAQFAEGSWAAATPCAEWRAAELAGHLRCVADDFHEYLDDAPGSRLARLMATGPPPDTLARKLARQNAAELATLPEGPATDHIAAFAQAARSYAGRLGPMWQQTHHHYRDTVVTVGAMAGAVCAEWHLHAWDLARALGKDYRPAAPEIVLAGWRAGVPQQPPPEGPWEDDPWLVLLQVSGRSADWEP
jgi:Mycothiol maleylpyruvate isomerase N-terminal domain